MLEIDAISMTRPLLIPLFAGILALSSCVLRGKNAAGKAPPAPAPPAQTAAAKPSAPPPPVSTPQTQVQLPPPQSVSPAALATIPPVREELPRLSPRRRPRHPPLAGHRPRRLPARRRRSRPGKQPRRLLPSRGLRRPRPRNSHACNRSTPKRSGAASGESWKNGRAISKPCSAASIRTACRRTRKTWWSAFTHLSTWPKIRPSGAISVPPKRFPSAP